MFDPLMALAFILLMCLVYLVGMALAVVGGVLLDLGLQFWRRVRDLQIK